MGAIGRAVADADAIDIMALEVKVHQTSAQRAAQHWTAYTRRIKGVTEQVKQAKLLILVI